HRVERVFEYFPTPADKEPLGIAYKALLVLRNIMRNLPSTPPSSENSWSYKLFFSQRTKLLETADYNPVLGREVFELVNEIQSS
ncbi:Chromatin structure-remodeling complex protein rsc9, partial [Ascosphaera atra]